MLRKIKSSIIFLFFAFAFLLCGCESKPAPIVLSSGSWPHDTMSFAAPVVAEDLPLLDGFQQLQSADFSGSLCYDEILSWSEAHPAVNVSYSVTLPDGRQLPSDTKVLDFVSLNSTDIDSVLALLKYFPVVDEISLPENLSLEQYTAFCAEVPGVKLNFSPTVAGITLSPEISYLDLSQFTSSQIEELLGWTPLLDSVKEIDLGTEDGRLSWDVISAISAACPDAVLNYSFELYGKNYTLADTSMDLYLTPIKDEGALVKKITSCMRNLEYLDMDSCGVSSAAMAEIRDSLPNTKVVWRIWFGDKYTVRTDVEKILASNPGMGGELLTENVQDLKYCTEVKYLDLGHNSFLEDVSFVGYMPKLEVVILAMDAFSDISGLANCPNLEYLELQTSALNDVRPLANSKNLKHLNIAFCNALTDISPLYNLTQLERLWIGKLTPISEEQINEFKSLVPDCEVNTGVLDPTEGNWRRTETEFGFVEHPRYAQLRDQFNYGMGNAAYAYYFNDPMCRFVTEEDSRNQ